MTCVSMWFISFTPRLQRGVKEGIIQTSPAGKTWVTNFISKTGELYEVVVK